MIWSAVTFNKRDASDDRVPRSVSHLVHDSVEGRATLERSEPVLSCMSRAYT